MTVSAYFDPFAAHYLADPYPALSGLRADEPVFFAPELDMWVLTRAADIEAVFTDPQAYSAAIAQDPLFPPTGQARDVLRKRGFDPPHTMSNLDPRSIAASARTTCGRSPHGASLNSDRASGKRRGRWPRRCWPGPPSTWSPSCRSRFRPT